MTKQEAKVAKAELKNKVELLDVKVLSIRQYGSILKVKINWRDYPKVRHLIDGNITFTF